jgi:hypothetical protein
MSVVSRSWGVSGCFQVFPGTPSEGVFPAGGVPPRRGGPPPETPSERQETPAKGEKARRKRPETPGNGVKYAKTQSPTSMRFRLGEVSHG